jgi:CRP-like cAMP-binding protein
LAGIYFVVIAFMQMVNEKRAFKSELRKFSFLASFSIDQLDEIAGIAPKLSLKKNVVVFRQGDHSAGMYLILKGGVKTEHVDSEGETINMGQLSGYQVFGELAILSKEPHQITVTTIEDTELLMIDRSMMLNIIRKSTPEQVLEIFSILSDQMRAASDRDYEDTLSRRRWKRRNNGHLRKWLLVWHMRSTPL